MATTTPNQYIAAQTSSSPTRPESADAAAGRSPSSTGGVLHNLSQRFRKGSNASSNTSDSRDLSAADNASPTAAATTSKQSERARANASRAAKRYLMTIVRNDWVFPSSHTDSQHPNFKPTQPLSARPDSKEPIAWRLRDAGSDDEADYHHHHHRQQHNAQQQRTNSKTKRKSKPNTNSDPYRFENPDAIADFVRERQVKRRKVLYEQMNWNDGLRHWTEQRDAWTGAVWKKPGIQEQDQNGQRQASAGSAELAKSQSTTKSNALGLILEKGDIPDSESTTATSFSSTSGANEGSAPTHAHQHQQHARYAAGTAVLSTPPHSPTGTGGSTNPNTSSDDLDHTTTITSAPSTDATNPASIAGKAPATTTVTTMTTTAMPTAPAQQQPLHHRDPTLQGPYLPLYPPLFPPSHLLRARIQPSAYSAIYSKIVVQCLTPNIPIPLPDMVRALVAGWKEEGNWPPQAQVTPLPVGAQGSGLRLGKGGSLTGGEGVFARWRRERAGRKTGSSNVVEGGNWDLGSLGAGQSGAGEQGLLGVEGLEEGDGNNRSGHRVRRSISSIKKALGMGEEAEARRRESEVGLGLGMGFEEEDFGEEEEGRGEEEEAEGGMGEGDGRAAGRRSRDGGRASRDGGRASRDEHDQAADRRLNEGLLAPG